ncbi:hypothetical protein [Micromonospora tarensis]|uniref:Uncharacterized protein n=1 Tax=Micromonospora tarensis TaxID=2806100 RepID=A0ABS1YBA6_9ACTN|nr:hypothetical protein [Micromonospora tarensis]MBM0274687.1 hypothetical protein [Micromonospora tarensis]
MSCAPWRIAWAERENERRRRAYRDATAAWRRRDEHLARLRIEAASFLGCTQPRAGLPVDLAADELVFRVLPVATLVEAEARHVPGLPTPGGFCSFTEASSEALPAGLRVVDTGMAVVTSHRVAFAGREHRREWRYADLVGLAHHPDVPVTLLPDHSRLAGLLVPAGGVVNFRFYLTLAAAVSAGDRSAVVAQVGALLAGHRGDRPTPMPLVGPDEAPLTAVRPDRRALGAAAVAAVVFATVSPGALGLGVWRPEWAGPVQRAEIVALDVPKVVLVPVLPVGPVAPRSRTGAVGRAAQSRPFVASVGRPAVPAPRPGVPLTVDPTILVDASPAVTPSDVTGPPASSVPTPGPVPSASPNPPTTSAAPTAPAPTVTPSSGAGLLTVCLDPLQLPVLDPLLCPSSAP